MNDNGKRVEYFFDFGSPTSYLAWTQLPQIAAAAGAEIVWRPMLLGGVFKATGNASPVSVPAKGRWMNEDIRRWAARYGVPFRHNPHFPINTLGLMRGAAGLQMCRPQDFGRYLEVVHRALWEGEKNLGDPAVLASILADAASTPTRSPRSSPSPRSRHDWSRRPRKPSRAASSEHRPSSSATPCSSARTGSTSSARRSLAPDPSLRAEALA
jgi:2-hydroxychromene-2-carboxylate isomerase